MQDLLKTDSLYLPNYVRNFQCQQCGECCLAKWRIEIDGHTHDRVKEKYVALGRENEFSKMMEKDAQGRINMNFTEGGRCSALTDKDQCRYQLELGHEYLSDTCKSYPRYIEVSPRGIELALTFSCKAAAASLKNQEKITFEQVDSTDASFFYMQPRQAFYYIPEKLPTSDIKHYYFQIEAGLIQIMQDRNFSIGERLVLIGRTLERLAALSDEEKNVEKIAAILAGYAEPVEKDEDYELHMNSLHQILRFRMKEAKAINNSINSLFKALATKNEDDLDGMLQILKFDVEEITIPADLYQEKLRRYYEVSSKDFSHVLEHYFINYIFNKGFYKFEWSNAFFRMAMLHSLIRFYALSFSVLLRKTADEDIVIRAIIETDNIFGHAEACMVQIWDSLKGLPDDDRHKIIFNMARD